MEYTKKSKLAEILEKKGAEKTLKKHGVPCVTCPMAKMEMDKLTIGDIADMYGLKIEEILKELNS